MKRNQYFIILKRATLIISGLLLTYAFLVILSNVQTKVTNEDILAFESEGFFATNKPSLYKDQLKLIADIQSKVLDKFPIGGGIPLLNEREPVNLNQIRRGLCFDRSRYLDKLYKYYGFETRHVYILYDTGKTFFESILTRGHPSHAITQVLTSRGWLVVDSNEKYLAVDYHEDPISLEQLQVGGVSDGAFREKFWPIIGLYSRNGMLYKPYLLVPELNLVDFIANFKK